MGVGLVGETVTVEQNVQFVLEMAKLQLFFAWTHLASHDEADLAAVLRRRTDICQKTVYWPEGKARLGVTDSDFEAIGEWLALEDELRTLYESTRGDTDSARFEAGAIELLRPALEPNVRKVSPPTLADGPRGCGSLCCDAPAEDTPKRIWVHIFNAVRPRSIFDDRRYLPECFECLMDKAEANYGADSLAIGTWLNTHPRWLELFPREWHENMEISHEVGPGLGLWGQFINRRGLLHERHAAEFRRTGRPPHAAGTSNCSFGALREHLRRYLAEQGGAAPAR